MYIKSIELHNWKGYPSAKFDFPKPGQRKNVVLIGADNGYGKTSLLEGFILCLYGAEGLFALPRAGGKGDQFYNEFLERALHVVARERGEMWASVKVIFEATSEDEEDQIGIERTWRFSGNGKHLPGDEDTQVWQGHDGTPVRVPAKEDRDQFYRGVIAQQVLPATLAPFFFFDGERVQRLARQNSSAQVKHGINGLLGIHVLQRLQEDLREVAANCRRDTRGADDGLIEQTKAEIKRLEESCSRKREERDRLRQDQESTRDERDARLHDFMLLAGGKDTLNELQEKRARYQRSRDQDQEELRQLLRGDLALALAGAALRERLQMQLCGEVTRLRWEQAKAEGERNRHLERLQAGLLEQEPPLPAPLRDEQWEVLRIRLRRAWEALQYPPPTDCSAEHRHIYLGEERATVLRHLERIGQLGLGGLEELLGRMDEVERLIRRATNDIAAQSGSREQMEALKNEIDRLNTVESQLHNKVGGLENELRAEEAELSKARANLGRMEEQYGRSRPKLRRAETADRIIALIEEIVPACYRRHGEQLNEAINEAYRAMAHKGTVSRIQIEDNADVRLFNDRNFDLRNLDASAGEDQIFSLALIAALARISRRDIPVIMDTPLARLDSKHRERVLDYFTARKGEQVILLSQPEEINERYYKQIETRICSKFLLQHEKLPGGMGINKVEKGRYFF